MTLRVLPVLVGLAACEQTDPLIDAWVGTWQITAFSESLDTSSCDPLTAQAAPKPFVSTSIARGFDAADDLISVFYCSDNLNCDGAPWISSVLTVLTETRAEGTQGAFSYFGSDATSGAGRCTAQLQALSATVDGDTLIVDVRATTAEGLLVENEQDCGELLSELQDSDACDAAASVEGTRLP